jgi:hypothetical protein
MSDEHCPNAANHTPTPRWDLAWQSWVNAMLRQGSRARRCPGCDRFTIWVGRQPPLDPEQFGTECFFDPRIPNWEVPEVFVRAFEAAAPPIAEEGR